MSNQNRLTAFATVIILLLFFGLVASSTGSFLLVWPVFVIVFLVIIVAIATGAMRTRPRSIQRPTSESTAFPPPPPPDSVLVKCEYCGTSQPFRELCSNCGAPLPKPGFTE